MGRTNRTTKIRRSCIQWHRRPRHDQPRRHHLDHTNIRRRQRVDASGMGWTNRTTKICRCRKQRYRRPRHDLGFDSQCTISTNNQLDHIWGQFINCLVHRRSRWREPHHELQIFHRWCHILRIEPRINFESIHHFRAYKRNGIFSNHQSSQCNWRLSRLKHFR